MHVMDGREGREAAFVKMTGEEIRMTVLLRIMWGTMRGRGEQKLEARLRSIPRGWMMYKQAFGLLTKVFDGLEKTIPDRQLAQINNAAAQLADCVVEVVYSIPVAVKGELPCV